MDQNQQTSINNNSGRKQIIRLIIIVLLAGCCLYLFLSKNNMLKESKTNLKQKQEYIDSVTIDRVHLQSDFEAASARIDQLISKNADMQDSIQANKPVINELQAQIKNILGDQAATQTELMKARNMINMLNDKTSRYERYIAELEKDNQMLTGEHRQLSTERDETVENNIALKMKAAVLHASNIRVEAIRHRRNGKAMETASAKKVDKIRIFFDVDENRMAESGTKQIYVRIIAPDTSVLYANNYSGTITTVEGREVKFSLLKEIELIKNKPLKNVVAEWEQKDIYPGGTYVVELYNGGYKIGYQRVSLK